MKKTTISLVVVIILALLGWAINEILNKET